MVQKVAHAVTRTVQAIVSAIATKMIAVLGLGGALVFFLIIAVIVFAIVSSPLSFLFGNDAEDQEMTIQDAIAQLNGELDEKIEKKKNSKTADEVVVVYSGSEGEGRLSNWPDVLAVYAVKNGMTNEEQDPEEIIDVSVMDKKHFMQLKIVFWNMNEVTAKVVEVEGDTEGGAEGEGEDDLSQTSATPNASAAPGTHPQATSSAGTAIQPRATPTSSPPVSPGAVPTIQPSRTPMPWVSMTIRPRATPGTAMRRSTVPVAWVPSLFPKAAAAGAGGSADALGAGVAPEPIAEDRDADVERDTETEPEPGLEPDASYPDGTPDEETATRKRLVVTVEGKTCEDMIEKYRFSQEQIEMLEVMLQPEYQELLAEMIGMPMDVGGLSDEEIASMMAALPEGLPEARMAIVEKALSLVGKIRYFWGGKSRVVGWDERFGVEKKVTKEGSPSTGTTRPFGLDCSGYTAYCFLNGGVPENVVSDWFGYNSWDQWQYSWSVPWEDVQPGDLAFRLVPGNGSNHVGIVVGFDEDGAPQIAHCASGKGEVVVTGRGTTFRFARRPYLFGEVDGGGG